VEIGKMMDFKTADIGSSSHKIPKSRRKFPGNPGEVATIQIIAAVNSFNCFIMWYRQT